MARTTPRFLTPGPESVLGRWMGRQARHPEEFPCAVRVVSGDLRGERRSWSYRRSAVDRFAAAPDVVLRHGDVELTLRFSGEPAAARGLRPHHAAWSAVEVRTGALVEVGGDVELAFTFGLDA